MRENFTSGSVGGLIEQSLALPGQKIRPRRMRTRRRFYQALAVVVRGQAFRNAFFAEKPPCGGKPLTPAKNEFLNA